MTIGLLNGTLLDYRHPDPALIDLKTMAIVLGRIPRFGGHTTRAVHVDEHSSRVGRFTRWLGLRSITGGGERRVSIDDAVVAERLAELDMLELHGNIHDAHEVYTPWGDLTDGKTDYHRKIEAGLDVAIYEALLLTPPTERIKGLVKQADKLALWWEAKLWAPSVELWTDLEAPADDIAHQVMGLIGPEQGEDWLTRTKALLHGRAQE